VARLPYLEKSALAPEHRDLLAREIALHKLLAHSPGALRAFQGLGQFIRHGSTLDPRLRELMARLEIGEDEAKRYADAIVSLHLFARK